MTTANFSYFGLEGIFVGLALFLTWGLHACFLWHRRRVIIKTLLLLVPYGMLADYVAIRWGIWEFNPQKLLPVWFLGVPLDELIWAVLVVTVISSAALLFADYERRGIKKREFPTYLLKR